MKIAHVVTYVSPDGAFGGPARVALGQAEELAKRGHDVTVYAAAPPELADVSVQDGYTLKTFPARRVAPVGGWAALSAPALTRALKIEAASFDIVHIHLARDLVTLPAARSVLRSGQPFVLQTHGMIDASSRLLSRVVDFLMTRTVISGASQIFTLTEDEDREVRRLGAMPENLGRLVNGIRITEENFCQARPRRRVIFVARLHPRKRVTDFARAAVSLAKKTLDYEFFIYGPDEGDAAAAVEIINQSSAGPRIRYLGAIRPEDVSEVMNQATLYVLPAPEEPFGLTIIEALAAGTPVLVHETAGLASMIVAAGVGATFAGSANNLANSIDSLLKDPWLLESMRGKAKSFVRQNFDSSHLVSMIEEAYERIAVGPSTSTGGQQKHE